MLKQNSSKKGKRAKNTTYEEIVRLDKIINYNRIGFCKAKIMLQHTITPGNKVYKENRIYMERIKNFCKAVNQIYDTAKIALEGKTEKDISPIIAANIRARDSALSETYKHLKELTNLIGKSTQFIAALPDSAHMSRYVIRFTNYNRQFTQYETQFKEKAQVFVDALRRLGLVAGKEQPLSHFNDRRRNSIKLDQRTLGDVFRDIRRKSYVQKYTNETEQQEHRAILDGQVSSLQSLIDVATKDKRRDRIDARLLVPLCELTFEEKIVDGSLGAVYRGVYRHQAVIIKTLEGIQYDDEQLNKRLFNEIKLMSKPRPHIVNLYGVGWEQNTKCMIMEYMEHGSLNSNLADRTFDLKEIQRIAIEIAIGLYNLHAESIVHGNLSSYNVLLDSANCAKLTDFSCSTTRNISMTSVKQHREPIEPIEWLAPETMGLQGKKTEQSDIYSFGMILWELVTGRQPYAKDRIRGRISSDRCRSPLS